MTCIIWTGWEGRGNASRVGYLVSTPACFFFIGLEIVADVVEKKLKD